MGVIFTFLHMVEKCSQTDLVEILPTPYDELCRGNLSTLHEYVVNMRGVQIQKLNGEASWHILEKECVKQQLMALSFNEEESVALQMQTKL